MTSVADQIKDRLSVVDVLGSYMTLIPAGKTYKARCPFHQERTPSFSISPDRGLYYCFGCGAKGDIFTFVQQFEGVDFNGALKILADRAGVPLTTKDQRADDAAPVYDLLEKTTTRYQELLKGNKTALEYLTARGLTPETIERFRLGYAPQEWRMVAHSASDAVSQKIAVRAGLIKQKEGSSDYYDRFRARIMFPLADASGRIVGFSGRMFPDTDEGPKYLNSPETEVFHKSRVLYGFDQAKGPIRRAGFTILVEGQMDLLLSHQAGFKNTVATSGTAVSETTIEDDRAALGVVARLSPHLFLAFDGDSAGQKALTRAALVALKLGMNPKVVPVPTGTDPADFLRDNEPSAWKQLLAESVHFLIHQARVIRNGALSPHQFVHAMREQLFPYLAAITSPVEQKLHMEALGKELGIAPGEVVQEFEHFRSAQPMVPPTVRTSLAPAAEKLSAKERFFVFAERYPNESAAHMQKLVSVSIAEVSFPQIDIQEEKKPLLLAIIERDFAMIDDQDRVLAAEELYKSAMVEFFTEVRTDLTAKLRLAEATGNYDTAELILGKIAELNTAWQDLR